MIEEVYVSFELAKLLKEKGFNEDCYTYYDDINDSINRFDKGYHFNNTSYPWGVPYDISKAKKYVVAPTHQMAMAWLREVHNLWLEISPEGKGLWYREVYSLTDEEYIPNSNGHKIKSYEDAVETALKYVLENLI